MPSHPLPRPGQSLSTDTLTALLAADLRPLPAGASPRRQLAGSLLVGTAAAGLLMLMGWGLRPGLMQTAALPMFWFKLAFAAVLVASAAGLLGRLSRPGRDAGAWAPAVALPFLALLAVVLAGLAAAPADQRAALLMGDTWRSCAPSLLALSVPATLAAGWALRQLAPTRLALAGAGAGALGGGVSVAVYALHCPEMSAPFMTWYGLGALLPMLVGAALGPRWLRW